MDKFENFFGKTYIYNPYWNSLALGMYIGSFICLIIIIICIKDRAWSTLFKSIPWLVLAIFAFGIFFSSFFDFVEIVVRNMV